LTPERVAARIVALALGLSMKVVVVVVVLRQRASVGVCETSDIFPTDSAPLTSTHYKCGHKDASPSTPSPHHHNHTSPPTPIYLHVSTASFSDPPHVFEPAGPPGLGPGAALAFSLAAAAPLPLGPGRGAETLDLEINEKGGQVE